MHRIEFVACCCYSISYIVIQQLNKGGHIVTDLIQDFCASVRGNLLKVRARHVGIRVVVVCVGRQTISRTRTPSAPSVIDIAVHVRIGRDDRRSVDVHLAMSLRGECDLRW